MHGAIGTQAIGYVFTRQAAKQEKHLTWYMLPCYRAHCVVIFNRQFQQLL